MSKIPFFGAIMKAETKEKKSLKESVKYWSLLNLGILLIAVGIYFFKAPNGFATGGVSGVAIILANVLPITTQATARKT